MLDWATNTSGQTGLKELDWNGNTVWQYYETRTAYHPHGDFQRIYDPKLGAYATLYLANKDVTAAQCIAAGCDPADAPYDGAQVDTIVEVDMSGNIVWEWSFWDHAIQNVDATKANYVGTGKTIADYPGKINLNLPGRPLRSQLAGLQFAGLQPVARPDRGQLPAGRVLHHRPRQHVPRRAIRPAASRWRPPRRAISSTASATRPATARATRRRSARNWETATSGNKQIGGSSNVQWIASRPARRRASAGVQQQPVPVPAHAAVLRVRDQSRT